MTGGKFVSIYHIPFQLLAHELLKLFLFYDWEGLSHQLDEPMGFSGGLGQQSIMLYFV